MAKATASLENSRRCEKLNSSEMSMRLLGRSLTRNEMQQGKGTAYSLALWIWWFVLMNALSMVKIAGYLAFPHEAWSLQA